MSRRLLRLLALLLLAGAVGLGAYNLAEGRRAGRDAGAILARLDPPAVVVMPSQEEITASRPSAAPEPTPTGETAPEPPPYLLAPELPMPVRYVDGRGYIAVLRIPALSLELPVGEQWSYEGLSVAPCRYSGSAYTGDLTIAGHNYSGHFARLAALGPGDLVTLTDMDGNVFRYRVAELTVLRPTQTREMTESGWELTLFTCTVGGRTRLAVRCEQLLP